MSPVGMAMSKLIQEMKVCKLRDMGKVFLAREDKKCGYIVSVVIHSRDYFFNSYFVSSDLDDGNRFTFVLQTNFSHHCQLLRMKRILRKLSLQRPFLMKLKIWKH